MLAFIASNADYLMMVLGFVSFFIGLTVFLADKRAHGRVPWNLFGLAAFFYGLSTLLVLFFSPEFFNPLYALHGLLRIASFSLAFDFARRGIGALDKKTLSFKSTLALTAVFLWGFYFSLKPETLAVGLGIEVLSKTVLVLTGAFFLLTLLEKEQRPLCRLWIRSSFFILMVLFPFFLINTFFDYEFAKITACSLGFSSYFHSLNPFCFSLLLEIILLLFFAFVLFFYFLERNRSHLPKEQVLPLYRKGGLFLVIVLLGFALGWEITENQTCKAKEEALESLDTAGGKLVYAIEASATNNRNTSALLASSPNLRESMTAGERPDLDRINHTLDRYNEELQSNVCYVLDAEGTCIASSNRNTPSSFVGNNYAFRPYYQEAYYETEGSYFALGTASGIRGYYTSHAILDDSGETDGVAVIKYTMEPLAEVFRNSSNALFVSPDNVVFIASRPDWTYKSLFPLSADELDRVASHRQFGHAITSLNLDLNEEKQILRWNGLTYLYNRYGIRESGWSVIKFTPIESLRLTRMYIIAFVFLSMMIFVSVSLAVFRIRMTSLIVEESDRLLRESEKQYRTMVENLPLAIYRTTPGLEGRFLTINEAGLKMFGYDCFGEFLKASVSEFYDDPQQRLKFSEKLKKQRKVIAEELLLKRKDGTQFWGAVTAQTIRNEKGEIAFFDGVIEDITERKKAREIILEHQQHLQELVERRTTDLKKAKEAAEAANVAKSAFLSNMSHEIRTPMTAILGYADLMLSRDDLDEKNRHYTAIINNSANKLLHLINSILDLSRIEAGRMELEPDTFNPADTITSVVEHLKPIALEKRLTIETSFEGDVPYFFVNDENKFRGILSNLIGNALKFTETGGVKIKGVYENDQLTVHVIDTGVGIPKDKKEIVFDAFAQADAASTRRYGGSGLGLTISRRYAEMLGGNITIESQEGEGTTVTVTIPNMKLCSISHESSSETPNGPGGGRLLLVEDEIEVGELVAQMLVSRGYRVKVASGGHEALEILVNDSTWDAVLSDVMMPGMSGVDLLAEAQRRNLKFCPFIAVTARAMADERENLLKSGFDAYVSKPIDFDVLDAAIRKTKKSP